MSSNTKPVLVWALYSAGIAAVLTPFIGAALAFFWRRGARANGDAEAAAEHSHQLRTFGHAAKAWSAALAIMACVLLMDIQMGNPVGSGVPSLFMVGIGLALLTQIVFTLYCLFFLFRSVFAKTPSGAAAA
ncbi:hypothetical protein [Primorskyibacter sp. S187A]|uniref:hypothetical protein n=1 Tax=Primorskyibacter sp. S187A TaxID=3415130 RepID=UPI003C7BA6BD